MASSAGAPLSNSRFISILLSGVGVKLYFRCDGKGKSVRPIAAIHISRGPTIYGTTQTSSSKMPVPL
jgi:hypothetical protein